MEATPVDPRVKQAMVNLLADMGIQPGTLEFGLVAARQSTDVTRPVSTITAPNDGAALRWPGRHDHRNGLGPRGRHRLGRGFDR